MPVRFAIYFGLVGLLLAFWRYEFSFAPVTYGPAVEWLYYICVFCPVFAGARSGLTVLFGPLNAIVFGIAGFRLGKAVEILKNK